MVAWLNHVQNLIHSVVGSLDQGSNLSLFVCLFVVSLLIGFSTFVINIVKHLVARNE